jgi:glutathione S-transferase
VATLRFWRFFIGEAGLNEAQRSQIPAKEAAGNAALALMDAHLSRTPFFIGDRLTLADITLYAYTHFADDGGFDLGRYPAVIDWLARVAALPGHIAIDA